RLTSFRIKILQIGARNLARAFAFSVAVDECNRWLGENGNGRNDDLELIRSQLFQGEESLVLPGEKHIADAALHEGRGRSARADVEDRHVPVERANIVANSLFAAVERVLRPGPGGEKVPTRPARRLRVRRNHLDTPANENDPVLDTLS